MANVCTPPPVGPVTLPFQGAATVVSVPVPSQGSAATGDASRGLDVRPDFNTGPTIPLCGSGTPGLAYAEWGGFNSLGQTTAQTWPVSMYGAGSTASPADPALLLIKLYDGTRTVDSGTKGEGTPIGAPAGGTTVTVEVNSEGDAVEDTDFTIRSDAGYTTRVGDTMTFDIAEDESMASLSVEFPDRGGWRGQRLLKLTITDSGGGAAMGDRHTFYCYIHTPAAIASPPTARVFFTANSNQTLTVNENTSDVSITAAISAPCAEDLYCFFTLTGTATKDADYTATPDPDTRDWVTIPAGSQTAEALITPLEVGGDVTVTLTLTTAYGTSARNLHACAENDLVEGASKLDNFGTYTPWLGGMDYTENPTVTVYGCFDLINAYTDPQSKHIVSETVTCPQNNRPATWVGVSPEAVAYAIDVVGLSTNQILYGCVRISFTAAGLGWRDEDSGQSPHSTDYDSPGLLVPSGNQRMWYMRWITRDIDRDHDHDRFVLSIYERFGTQAPEYDNTKSYVAAAGEVAYYDGGSGNKTYRCIADTTGNAPTGTTSDNTWWEYLQNGQYVASVQHKAKFRWPNQHGDPVPGTGSGLSSPIVYDKTNLDSGGYTGGAGILGTAVSDEGYTWYCCYVCVDPIGTGDAGDTPPYNVGNWTQFFTFNGAIGSSYIGDLPGNGGNNGAYYAQDRGQLLGPRCILFDADTYGEDPVSTLPAFERRLGMYHDPVDQSAVEANKIDRRVPAQWPAASNRSVTLTIKNATDPVIETNYPDLAVFTFPTTGFDTYNITASIKDPSGAATTHGEDIVLSYKINNLTTEHTDGDTLGSSSPAWMRAHHAGKRITGEITITAGQSSGSEDVQILPYAGPWDNAGSPNYSLLVLEWTSSDPPGDSSWASSNSRRWLLQFNEALSAPWPDDPAAEDPELL